MSLGVVEEVISEGPEAAHVNPEIAIENVCSYVSRTLRELSGLSPEELVAERQQRFAQF